MSQVPVPSPLFQLLIAGTAFAGFFALSGGIIQGQFSSSQTPTELVVEHTTPIDLYVKFSKHSSGQGIMLLSHNGNETIHVSVPQSWQRTEVRNVPLIEVKGEDPQLGFVRWALPATASVQFRMPVSPASLAVKNPSGIPVKVEFTNVHLEQNSSDFRIVLVQDSPATLW